MKKRNLFAWMLSTSMMISSVGSVFAMAQTEPTNSLLIATKPTSAVSLTQDMVSENGILVIEQEMVDSIVIPKELKAKKIVLKGIQASQILLESGADYIVEIQDSEVANISILEPKVEVMDSKKISQMLQEGVEASVVAQLYREYLVQKQNFSKASPKLVTKGTITIDSIVVSSNVKLELEQGQVENVTIDCSGSNHWVKVEVSKYNGTVTVNQSLNETKKNLLRLDLKDSQLEKLNISSEKGAKCSINSDKSSKVTIVEVDGNASINLSVETEKVHLNENAKKVAISIYSAVNDIVVEGDDNEIRIGNSAKVSNAVVEGNDVSIYGNGKLGSADITGKGANVSVRGADVEGENDNTPPSFLQPVDTPTPTRKPIATSTPKPTVTSTPEPTVTNTPTPKPTATNTPTPTATVTPTATSTPVPTATSTPVPTATSTPTPTATNTPKPTATNTPKPTATNTPKPTATNTPKPTATSTPTPTATNTPKPTATNTPKPTATSTPTPTATNTPTPTATNTPTPTPMFPNIIDKSNTTMNDTCFTSETEVTEYFLEMVLNNYYTFGILAQDLSMLHTAEEYMELCPAILDLEIDSVTKYYNGYYISFKNIKTYQIDAEEVYAILTEDTSFLDEEELKAYQKLFSITEELDLEGKSDIDKIVAIHDYLVLNTAYDSNTASGATQDKSAHYVEGTLNNGLAVCSGYASAFRLLLMLQDIPCEYVWSEDGNHGWNLVQLDGEWYHIDVTWDDPVPDEEGRLLYTHFMMTDEEVATLDSHEDWECECGNASSHNCDDTTYRLYPYEDYICNTEDEAIANIEEQASNDTIIIVYPSNSTVLTENSLTNLVMTTLKVGISWTSQSLGSSYNLLQVQPSE